MAENRGLFGSNTSPAKAKSSKKKEVVEERKPKVHRRRLKSREVNTFHCSMHLRYNSYNSMSTNVMAHPYTHISHNNFRSTESPRPQTPS